MEWYQVSPLNLASLGKTTSFPGFLFSASLVVGETKEAGKRRPGNEVEETHFKHKFNELLLKFLEIEEMNVDMRFIGLLTYMAFFLTVTYNTSNHFFSYVRDVCLCNSCLHNSCQSLSVFLLTLL